MSGDYEKAIEFGSTSVRVGSLIFGARNLWINFIFITNLELIISLI